MPNVSDFGYTREDVQLYVDLSRDVSVSDNARTTESIIFESLNINVHEDSNVSESITRRLDSLIFIIDKYEVKDIVNTEGLITFPHEKISISESISLTLTNLADLEIKIYESIYVSEFLFNGYDIFVYDDSYAIESITLADFNISIIENVITSDHNLNYIEETDYGVGFPTGPTAPGGRGTYSDHLSADLLKGDKYFETVTTFWNQPFPDTLLTEKGNKANFETTFNKTHSSLRNRKCAIKAELIRSDNSIQIMDIGTFLMGTSEQNDDIITIQLEDLTKKFIETPADDVKSGFQWYRNIPLTFLVKELVKKSYPDPRNGEVPRDYIIQGVRPPNPSGEPIVSSLGRPPTFTKLTNNLNSIGKTNALVVADLGIKGERLYLGVGKFLYEYDELTQTYLMIDEIKSDRQDAQDIEYQIKKLWFNEATDFTDKYLYGMAWPKEELVLDEGEFESDGVTPRKKRYSCITGNDYIIFRANNNGIENLFDSATKYNDGYVGYTPSLFTGEYHILEPYAVGKFQTAQDYNAINESLRSEHIPSEVIWTDWYPDFPCRALHTGYGSVDRYTFNPGQSALKERKNIKANGQEYPCGYTENVCLPFAQKIGFGGNLIQEYLKDQWIANTSLNVEPGEIGWLGNHPEIGYTPYYNNFGFSPGPEYYGGTCGKGWRFIGIVVNLYKYRTLDCRARIYVRGAQNYWDEQPHFIRHSGSPNEMGVWRNTNGILYTKVDESSHITLPHPPAGYEPLNYYNDHEISDPSLPGVHYEQESPDWENLPYENISNHNFDPGYLSWNFEGFLRQNVSWQHAPIFYLKYTSGQSGSVTYLKNWGTKGGVFFQGQVKHWVYGPAYSPQFKTMGWRDFYTDSSLHLSMTPLQLEGYIFDLDTKVINRVSKMDKIEFRDQREDGNQYPMQITAVTPYENEDGTYDLVVAAQTFPNKHHVGGYQPDFTNRWQSKAYMIRFQLKDYAENGTVPLDANPSYFISGPPGDFWNGHPDYVITDLNVLSNSETPATRKIYITYYEKQKLIKEYDFEGRPIIDNCYGLAHCSIGSTGITYLRNNAFDPYVSGDRLMPYPMHRIIESSIKTPGNNYFYAVEPMSRTEEINCVRLRKFCYDDTFVPRDGNGGDSHPYYDPSTFKNMWISDAVYGESNQLSNLVTMTLDNFEIVYGVTDGYYANPIHRSSSKNHLWKYDTYLGGIIELADLNGLSVWDAITQLAEGFNFLTGFDDERFFFIPKTLSSTPDILIDADLDGVIEISKVRDYKVENIIRSTPYIAKLGDIEWEVVVVPNETTANDTDRVQLNVDLRIRQEDDLTKTVTLKVYRKGSVPESSDTTSPLRFTYLTYNNVIETKLMRDLGANDLQFSLPSFYGQDLSSQVMAGDVIALEETNEETGDTSIITRTITSVNYDSNMVTVNSCFGKIFLAYTPVTIYRSFTNDKGELRNNQWSDSGVTYIDTNWIAGIWNDETDWYTDRYIEVGSIRNLSIGTIIKLGDYPSEHIIYDLKDGSETANGKPGIYFRAYQGSTPIPDGTPPLEVQNNKIIRAFWVPTYNDMTEVGGSKVFLGFAPGSTGTFWQNFRGDDKINIKCPGLILESDSRAIITVVDSDSIARFGKASVNLNDNRFIQPSLHEYMARNYLHANSKPRLQFKVKNFIQTVDKGGYSYMLPTIKLLNTSERKLFTVRLISKKLLPRFWGYFTDCYIMEHGFSLKTFIQDMLLKSKDTY